MKRSTLILVSAVIFALIGLAAGCLAVSNLEPPTESASHSDSGSGAGRAYGVMFVVFLPTLGGACLGLVIGIFAAVVGHFADGPAESLAGDQDATQPYAKKPPA